MINAVNVMKGTPCAKATVKGSDSYPCIKGEMNFYQTDMGVLVCAQVKGLPKCHSECRTDIFALHLHEGNCCSGNDDDPFADAKSHYNPRDCKHPYHAGDMPPLWGNKGCAFLAFLTDRFCVNDIVGRTVIIHAMPDDFMTQPSGNAGEKIACGVVERCCRC